MIRRLASSVYAKLMTEKSNPRSRGLDKRSSLEIARAINRDDQMVARAVSKELRSIAKGIDIIAAALEGGGSILFLGAGTSGRLAVLEAAECPPTFNTTPRQILAVMAGGKASVFRSKEGAEDNAAAGAAAVKKMKRGDVVVGIAASGVTPFVRAALRAARGHGCRTVLVTSHGKPPDNPAELLIAPVVGPEVVSGSTRMKSGTAAKLVLNSLTTGAMVRLGKVYDNWMVDLKPTSRKLELRGMRIVAALCRVDARRANGLFLAADGSVKTAVVMGRMGVNAKTARELLASCGGSLRRALEGR